VPGPYHEGLGRQGNKNDIYARHVLPVHRRSACLRPRQAPSRGLVLLSYVVEEDRVQAPGDLPRDISLPGWLLGDTVWQHGAELTCCRECTYPERGYG
jgi:hypothetical protein